MFAGCLRVKLSDIGETNGSPCLRINKETRIILLRPKKEKPPKERHRLIRVAAQCEGELGLVTLADPGHFSLTVLILFFPLCPISHISVSFRCFRSQ